MYFEYFEETRAAVFVLLGQPVAVASVVLLAGINAALWLLVFKRAGFPTALASLLVVPPLNFLVPLCFAFARWPGTRKSTSRARAVHRGPVQRHVKEPVYAAQDHRWPMRLASDGLPRFRIQMGPPGATLEGREYLSQFMQQ